MAKLLDESLNLGDLPHYVSGDSKEEQNRRWKAYTDKLDALQKISDALPEGEIKGGLLSFGVADGQAHYLVVKERPLTLQHIDFLDGYRVHDALIKGLDRADIEIELNATRRRNKFLRRTAQVFAENRK